MRIGIDCRLWNETGVGRYIRNLVKGLARIDTKNEYILLFKKNEFDTIPLPAENFKKRLANIPWHSFAEQTKLKKILEQEKLDLVHFPYFSYPVTYPGKFVITIHDLIIDHFPTGKASTLPSIVYYLKRIGYRYILQRAVRNAQKIIAVSKSTKQEIIDHYHAKPDSIIVTYEGIDSSVMKEEEIDVPAKFFFSVGNAYPHKNLERLVNAFSLFHEKNPEVKHIFVGKRDFFSKKLEKVVQQKKLSEVVLFYPDVSDGQLAYLYKHAIGLVIPSLMEGFGLPLLEAMHNNCLVIASEIPAFLEVAGDVPVYFDPYNELDIAKKLESVYKREIAHLEEKRKKGIVRSKIFSWNTMSEETLKAYQLAA